MIAAGPEGLTAVSIHAPRAEGDLWQRSLPSSLRGFNPRPPRGGRLAVPADLDRRLTVSIHAPRAEGDAAARVRRWRSESFNPRPPRGGRPDAL